MVFTGDEDVDPFAAGEDSMAGGPTHASAFADQSRASKSPPTVVEFRTIDVELVWIRFELAGDLKERLHEEPAAITLRSCRTITLPKTGDFVYCYYDRSRTDCRRPPEVRNSRFHYG
jgi:hypothetical protein